MQNLVDSSKLPTVVLDTRSILFLVSVFLLCASSLAFPSRPAANSQHHNQPLNQGEKTVVIAYHKPPNVITSHSDAEALAAAKSGPRRTVYEDVQSLERWVGHNPKTANLSWKSVTGIQSKLHAIGRLDCDTTGLLLLTNDGGLVHHVTNPKSKESSLASITKTYEAVIMGHHENEDPSLENMRSEGVDIGAKYGGMTRPPVDLRVLDHPTAKSTRVSITIGEGKNRQVRRMFHSIGSGVMKLKRMHIGEHLNLEDLEMGQWRILSAKEVQEALDWRVRTIEDKHLMSRVRRDNKKFEHGKPKKQKKRRRR